MEPESNGTNTRRSADTRRRIDIQILEELSEGRCTPGYLANELEYQQPYISQRLAELSDESVVTRVDRGLYELNVDAEVVLNGSRE